MKILKLHNSQVNSRFSIGEQVLFKSMKTNQFLQPQYIGPADIVRIDHKKCYLLKWNETLIRRHESHLKRTRQLETTERVQMKEIERDCRRYPKREKRDVHRYV